MAKIVKRDPNRCPTHPGALLREDIMPAVRRNVKELAGCSASRASTFPTL